MGTKDLSKIDPSAPRRASIARRPIATAPRPVDVRVKWIGWFLFVLVSATSAIAADDSAYPDSPANLLGDEQLVDALRGGGYVLYFRHGITDHTTYDRDRNDLENCSLQRLLSDQGRAQMRAIGNAIRQLDIRVSTVSSSPYCRSIDTAVQAFGRMQVNDDLKHTVIADEATVNRQAEALRRLLATPPAAGTNSVLSSHTANLQDATGIWPKPEGAAVVFQPDGAGGFRYIATIHPDLWQDLLRFARP